MTDTPPEADSTAPLTAPRRYRRDGVEFARSIAYVDATFAIAATLLVTTLDPGESGWSNWTNFSAAEWKPLVAFALSFAVISAYWWMNHQLVASLASLSPPFVFTSLAMLAFIALLPFSTGGLGESGTNTGEVSTVVYALNIAAVSLASSSLVVIAYRDRLFTVPPSAREFRARMVRLCDTPLVFLASIPICIFVSPAAARVSWALLFLTGAITRRVFRPTLARM